MHFACQKYFAGPLIFLHRRIPTHSIPKSNQQAPLLEAQHPRRFARESWAKANPLENLAGIMPCCAISSNEPCGHKAESVLSIQSSGGLRVNPAARLSAKLEKSRGLPFWSAGGGTLNGKPSRSGRMPLRRPNIRLLNGWLGWSRDGALA